MSGQGDVAIVVEYDSATNQLYCVSARELPNTTNPTLQEAYILATDDPTKTPKIQKAFSDCVSVSSSPTADPELESVSYTASATASGPGPGHRTPDTPKSAFEARNPRWRAYPVEPTKHSGRRAVPPSHTVIRDGVRVRRPAPDEPVEVYVKTKKKYKPVAQKIRPVPATLPQHFRIVRNRVGDPLEGMPEPNPNPPPFQPTGRYTAERREQVHEIHREWLTADELAILDDLLCKQNEAFAWDDSERGRFRADMFPPVKLAVVDHIPYNVKNAPIPPGIFRELLEIIRKKIESGVYEPSNASYRTRWFCVLKKDGKLRIVHSLEPLNQITIQQSGVPPVPEHIAETFAGRACGSTFDLYVGYDEREIDPDSRDLTTFQTPFGAMRLTTLPMGWTNSVPIFHDDVTFILQPEMPDNAMSYIDDVFSIGPESTYQREDGTYETIPENPGVRRYVWEQFNRDNRIIQRMKHAGGTFSGKKFRCAAPDFTALGHRCTREGRIPEPGCVDAVINWGDCKDVSEVRAFLGTVGVARIFIKDYGKLANPLNRLLRKDIPFEWGPPQIQAMADLKAALLASPALRAIDYESDNPVVLAVDTSYIAVGFQLCQEDRENPKKRYYNRFGSITLNEREARFSQPKLELYGLYRALRAMKFWLVGVRNLIIEIDATAIKYMLDNPDMAPNAVMNRWAIAIKLFHYTLRHVPGAMHGPDGLSRRPAQPNDQPTVEEDDDFDDWVDNMYGFLHIVNPPFRLGDAPLLPTSARANEEVTVLFQQTSGPTRRAVDVPVPDYDDIPRSRAAESFDERLEFVHRWLDTKTLPPMTERARDALEKYARQFFVHDGRLWKVARDGQHKRVLPRDTRARAMVDMHDHLGHRGIAATIAMVGERFWWPEMKADIAWYVRSCHKCQVRQTWKVYIPPTVAVPAPPMVRVHVDTMDMPGRYKHFFHARCATTSYCEGRAATVQNAKTLGDWIYQDLLCRWGAVGEIISDNGSAFLAALDYVATQYHVSHIRISGYNSRANGVVERGHFHIRDALYKACEGDPESEWVGRVYSVLWADRVTVRRRLGCSPYYAVTGTHPILPFDIAEATYLMPTPVSLLTTAQLIAQRAIALQKRPEQIQKLRSVVYEARVRAAERFEREHVRTVKDFNFKRGHLVLMRNTAVEKSLNRKMKPRYLGPLVVIARNRGGAYIVAELDGATLDRPVAAFRLIPYFARRDPINFDLNAIDISTARLRELEQSDESFEDEGLDVEDPSDD